MPDANPGGPGGRRKKIQTNVPRGRTSHQKKKGCCSMVAAVRAVRRGKYRLARRYAVMTLRVLKGRLA